MEAMVVAKLQHDLGTNDHVAYHIYRLHVLHLNEQKERQQYLDPRLRVGQSCFGHLLPYS